MALYLNTLLLITILTTTTSHLLVLSQQFRDAKTIDRVVRDCAFQTFDRRRRTAVLYRVPMPANLSAVSSETVRLRTGRLWRYGARIKEFSIKPGVVLVPHTKRTIAVRQNLGNLSSAYSSSMNMSEYQFMSPVLGLLLYNAQGSFKKLRNQPQAEILVTKNPIRIDFSGLVADLQGQEEALCVLFDLDGKPHVSNQISRNVCASWQQGHFALILPKNNSSTGSSVVVAVGDGKKLSRWKVAAVTAASALLATVLLVLIVVAVVSEKKRRSRMAERERRAYEEEALQVSMVDHVRAPRATVARTAPVLEDDCVLTV